MAKRSGLTPKEYDALKDQVLRRDGFRCRNPACKRRNGLHVHHIIFRGRRGKDESSNLATICHNCHDRIHGTQTPGLVVLAKSGDPKDKPNADVGLRFITKS